MKKLKSSILAGLSALLLLFPSAKSSLPDIAKPYLGVYECTQATLGGKDLLDKFSTVLLELNDDENFTLVYEEKGVKRKQIKGKYDYDEKRGVLTLSEKSGIFKREFPLNGGRLTITFPVGGKTAVLQFEQK